MKIVSVLTYPFENGILVKVTRSQDYFTFPQKTKNYFFKFDSPHYISSMLWASLLSRLNLVRLSIALYSNYMEKHGNQS